MAGGHIACWLLTTTPATTTMRNPELYQKTVDILVAAYFNDTLQHNNCYACAVGNIVAANSGMKFRADPSSDRPIYWDGYTPYSKRWRNDNGVPIAKTPGWFAVLHPDTTGDKKQGESEVAASGYDSKDLGLIEYAFEAASRGYTPDEYMFNGLMAVIDVLDKIHGNTDAELTSQSKKRFKCAKSTN